MVPGAGKGASGRDDRRWGSSGTARAQRRIRKSGRGVVTGLVLSPIRPIDRQWNIASTVGLLARGSNRALAFPATAMASGPMSARLRLQLRGQLRTCTGFPVIPSRGPWTSVSMAEGVGPVNRDIRISLYHLSSGFFMGTTKNCRNRLTRIPNAHTTYSVSWSPGSQGRVLNGKTGASPRLWSGAAPATVKGRSAERFQEKWTPLFRSGNATDQNSQARYQPRQA